MQEYSECRAFHTLRSAIIDRISCEACDVNSHASFVQIEEGKLLSSFIFADLFVSFFA